MFIRCWSIGAYLPRSTTYLSEQRRRYGKFLTGLEYIHNSNYQVIFCACVIRSSSWRGRRIKHTQESNVRIIITLVSLGAFALDQNYQRLSTYLYFNRGQKEKSDSSSKNKMEDFINVRCCCCFIHFVSSILRVLVLFLKKVIYEKELLWSCWNTWCQRGEQQISWRSKIKKWDIYIYIYTQSVIKILCASFGNKCYYSLCRLGKQKQGDVVNKIKKVLLGGGWMMMKDKRRAACEIWVFPSSSGWLRSDSIYPPDLHRNTIKTRKWFRPSQVQVWYQRFFLLQQR